MGVARGWTAGAVAALALAAAGGCHRPQALGRTPEPGDRAAASVNGQTVWASDVRREALAQGIIGPTETLEAASPLFGRTLDQVVDQKLLASEAVQRRLDRGARAQRRLAAARERVLSDLLVDEVVVKAIDDADVRRLYQEQLKLARRGSRIHARQIVVPTAAEAQQVRRLLAGGAAFEALALERSSDAETRFSGGDLGYFNSDLMPAPYAAALKDSQPGALVGPFPVSGGYAVVRVEDRRTTGSMSFAEARPQIVRFLTYDEIRDLLTRLRDKGEVKMLIARPRRASPPPPTPAPPPVPTPAAEAQPPPGYTPPGGLRPATPAAPPATKAGEAAR